VGLAQAILHDPEVLVLDEPTDGLDPNQKHEVRTLIKKMAKEKAIILSTHILEEVQAVCTRAMIIAKGKVVTDGTPADLEERSPNHNTVILAIRGGNVSEIQARLMNVNGVKRVQELGTDGDLTQFRIFPDPGKWIIADVGHCAKEHQWEVDELSVDRGQLDDVFRSLTISKQELT
jgi:ABC-2 type transport system ATP-binding protein